MQTRRAFAPRARPARAPSQTRASPRARSRPRASIASRASIEFHFAITAQLDYGDSLALVGDASDNVAGVRGCGPKSAVAFSAQIKFRDALLSTDRRAQN